MAYTPSPYLSVDYWKQVLENPDEMARLGIDEGRNPASLVADNYRAMIAQTQKYSDPAFGGLYTAVNPYTGVREPLYTKAGEPVWGGEFGNEILNYGGTSKFLSEIQANPSLTGYAPVYANPSRSDLGYGEGGLSGFLDSMSNPLGIVGMGLGISGAVGALTGGAMGGTPFGSMYDSIFGSGSNSAINAGTAAAVEGVPGIGSNYLNYGSIPGGSSTMQDLWQNAQSYEGLGSHGLSDSSTYGMNGLDAMGNVVDANMPGSTPGYTPPTGIQSGNVGNGFLDYLRSQGLNLPPEVVGKIDQLTSLGATPTQLAQLFGAKTATGAYQFPFGQVLGGLLSAYGASQKQGDLQSALQASVDYADPFRTQRPGYQAQFKQLTQNPTNFFQDPAIANMVNLADQETSRKLASQGYNMSGNFAGDVAARRSSEMFKNYMPYAQMIGTAAGYNQGSGVAGQLAGTLGQAVANEGQNIWGGLGAATQSAMTGAQPSYLQQIFGQQPNQNLWTSLTTPGAA